VCGRDGVYSHLYPKDSRFHISDFQIEKDLLI
jgi:hypothetical protein